MAQSYSLHIQSADQIIWDSGFLRRGPKLYVTVDVDGSSINKTPVFERSLRPEWNFRAKLLYPLTSVVTLRLYHSTFIPGRRDPFLGEYKTTIEDLFHQCSSNKAVKLEVKANGKVSGRVSVLLESIGAAALSVVDELQRKIGKLGSTESSVDVSGIAQAARDWATVISTCVKMGGEITKVHPYATAAWKILTSLYQAIEKQREMDDEVVKLVKTMVEINMFHWRYALTHIAEQSIECANFLDQYSREGFSGRTFQNTFLKENKQKIQDLCNELVKLKDSFDRGLAIQTNRRCWQNSNHLPYDASLRSECLAGTRTDVLDGIIQWLNTPSDTSKILWLSGVAGSGKSTIATSISQHFRNLQRLGAFIFFDRNNLANSNPATVLHSIAYKLAQVNRQIWDTLCEAINCQPDIVNAPIGTQFQELLLGPFNSAQINNQEPVIIILDALDECSNKDSPAFN
ncbi:hypothetical protein B0H14DRAFT_2759308, partial [Mycena olivaceomarginata]